VPCTSSSSYERTYSAPPQPRETVAVGAEGRPTSLAPLLQRSDWQGQMRGGHPRNTLGEQLVSGRSIRRSLCPPIAPSLQLPLLFLKASLRAAASGGRPRPAARHWNLGELGES
jgi:hypothetical protein